MTKKMISILAPCYNEAENIPELYRRLIAVINQYSHYNFEILIIDNASTDNTVEILKEIALKDLRLKIIVNIRNFGQVRSPHWGFINTKGDATISLASDLQDPPELIPQFIAQWESGWKIVLAVKPKSKTNFFMHHLRRLYYRVLDSISDVDLVADATGFGLYDRQVMDEIRKVNDPYPYVRGLICEFGFPIKTIPFNQPRREHGVSSNNFFTLFDMAMLGIVSHSVVPIRLATLLGLFIGLLSMFAGIYYGLMKIMYWDTFPIGMAPLVIGFFFMASLLLVFLGLIGEYVASIHIRIKNLPLVVEKERINF